MLSTLSILLLLLLLLLLTEADVQLSLFKAGAVWLLMLRAPSCSFALLSSYLHCARLGAQLLFHVSQRFDSERQTNINSKKTLKAQKMFQLSLSSRITRLKTS